MLSDSISKSLKDDKFTQSIKNTLREQDKMRRLIDLPQKQLSDSLDMKSIKEISDNSAIQITKTNENVQAMVRTRLVAINALEKDKISVKDVGMTASVVDKNSVLKSLGEIAISVNSSNYVYRNPMLEQMNRNIANTLRTLNDVAARTLADSAKNIVAKLGSKMIQVIQSPAMEWIKSIDMTPMRMILEHLQLNEDVIRRYKEFNHVYLTAMYECNWFPYAGWSANVTLAAEISEILSTSRGASKRREKRIDKAILSYYTPQEIRSIKRSWNNSELEPFIKKILGQAIAAYLRGEYVLTITCLSTMWEGLIHKKIHVTGRYSQKNTNQDFKILIDENEFDSIFSDFYMKLIVSQCDTPDDVIEGIPNRNGVSHSKYKKYPNRKAGLNAILLTDFILSLEPLTRDEEPKE